MLQAIVAQALEGTRLQRKISVSKEGRILFVGGGDWQIFRKRAVRLARGHPRATRCRLLVQGAAERLNFSVKYSPAQHIFFDLPVQQAAAGRLILFL